MGPQPGGRGDPSPPPGGDRPTVSAGRGRDRRLGGRVTVLIPANLDEAISGLAANPAATLLAGGTDLMVEVNEGHRQFAWPEGESTVISLAAVHELSTWTVDGDAGTVTLGATVTWSEIEQDPLRAMLPALAEAARTVGSPQIRNAGTVGGNLATCSPAGDGLPVFAALDARVNLIGSGGRRTLPVGEFMVGV